MGVSQASQPFFVLGKEEPRQSRESPRSQKEPCGSCRLPSIRVGSLTQGKHPTCLPYKAFHTISLWGYLLLSCACLTHLGISFTDYGGRNSLLRSVFIHMGWVPPR
uniref:Uncharacterized protein n=1 Tax=Picea glauca TaxID=3330 RepID=A0A101M118_PICGL|nr:hypothetical protein ABT39_MTgene4341 [Picea glauca]